MTRSGVTIRDIIVQSCPSSAGVRNGSVDHNGDCPLLAERTDMSHSNRKPDETFEETTDQYRSLLELRARAHWEG